MENKHIYQCSLEEPKSAEKMGSDRSQEIFLWLLYNLQGLHMISAVHK